MLVGAYLAKHGSATKPVLTDQDLLQLQEVALFVAVMKLQHPFALHLIAPAI